MTTSLKKRVDINVPSQVQGTPEDTIFNFPWKEKEKWLIWASYMVLDNQ